MKVFVTGASGFIGSYLCRELLDAGHEVAVLLRNSEAWRIVPMLERIHIIEGDLASQVNWKDKLTDFAPDSVAHLAWLGVSGGDRNSPNQNANIGWTTDLFDLACDVGVNSFLALGSQAEYGPHDKMIGPSTATHPTSLYGEVKLATYRLLENRAAKAGVRFVWMRVFSTYGPGDHPYWMIPSLIKALLNGERPALTAGEQLWDFLHVRDAVRAMRLALEIPAASGVYALGSGEAPPLRSTIELIRDSVDMSLSLGLGDVPYRPDQVMRLQADVTGLWDDLGWRAEVPLSSGIPDTVAWYAANRWIFDTP